ncbi:hypothetical protein [Bacillus sp. SA1-12]|nr:hypothetical protein [Bacillus sp. SA1-12]
MFAETFPKNTSVSTAIYVSIDSGNMKLAWLSVCSRIVITANLLDFV